MTLPPFSWSLPHLDTHRISAHHHQAQRQAAYSTLPTLYAGPPAGGHWPNEVPFPVAWARAAGVSVAAGTCPPERPPAVVGLTREGGGGTPAEPAACCVFFFSHRCAPTLSGGGPAFVSVLGWADAGNRAVTRLLCGQVGLPGWLVWCGAPGRGGPPPFPTRRSCGGDVGARGRDPRSGGVLAVGGRSVRGKGGHVADSARPLCSAGRRVPAHIRWAVPSGHHRCAARQQRPR